MKILKKLLAVTLSIILAFSCVATLTITSHAASILAISIVQYPTKLKYYYLSDWTYGYYTFPEGCNYGTLQTTGSSLTFEYNNKTYKKICFLRSNGYYTEQYFDRGLLDLRGLVIRVLYSDFTEKTITYEESVKGYSYHQNIYANPSLGDFFVGTNKIIIYLPENKQIRTTFNIEILETTQYPLGDVNMDNKVNSSDALLILQSVVNIKNLTSVQKSLADVNKDLRINSTDALDILKITVGS